MSSKLTCRFCLEEIPNMQDGEKLYLFLKSEDCIKYGTLGKGICFEPILASNFPDLNPNLTKEPVVCWTCADEFMASSLFKFKLLESEEKVTTAADKCSRRLVNLRALVYQDSRKIKQVCRTCLQLIRGGKFRPVHSKADGSYDQLVMSLLDCFPKIDFNISVSPVICQSCIYESTRYCKFRAKCYKIEKVIIDYLAKNDVKFGTMNLSDMKIHLLSTNVPIVRHYTISTMSMPSCEPPPPPVPKIRQYSPPVRVKTEIVIDDSDAEDDDDDCVIVEPDIKTEVDEAHIKALIDYEFDEDIERKINLQPPWEPLDPLGEELEEPQQQDEDEEPFEMTPGSLVKVLIKDEAHENISEDPSECYTSVDESGMNMQPAKTCVKTCVKCLDTRRECNHMKKDLVWYNCPLCSYQTHWKHHLNRHKLIHGKNEQKDKHFRCRQCDFKSPFKHVVMRHNSVSHAEDFKCDECPFTTKFKFTLTTHIKTVHRPEELIHKCPECPYTSKWKYHIKRHMFRHSFK